MQTAFSLSLNQQLVSGLLTVGKFDGQTPSLACATRDGKVLLHSPHEGGVGGAGTDGLNGRAPAVRYLNFNRKITALRAGHLSSGPSAPDLLFVGTQSNLLAYDTERNADVFFRDVQDGVNTLLIGRATSGGPPLVIAGGNCSILGFDAEGKEVIWTVTGDNVSSMAYCDVNSDGVVELLVGSDDFEIRSFRGEELLSETVETDRVTHLSALHGAHFAYGLANGTVGAYNGSSTRLWRVKTKHRVTSLQSFDVDGDGVPEVVSGWSNGLMTVRRAHNGEMLFKEMCNGSAIAGIVCADYRMDGKEEVIVCTESGEIRGYLPADAELLAMTEDGVLKANTDDQKEIARLQAEKQELTAELRLLEKSLQAAKAGGEAAGPSLPTETALSYYLEANERDGYVSLRVEVSNNDVQIANLVAIDHEGAILEGSEVLVVSPASLSKTAILPFRPTKNQAGSLRIQTHVSVRGSYGSHSQAHNAAQLHVFETVVDIPKFSVFRLQAAGDSVAKPVSAVTLLLNESAARLAEWVKSAFLLPPREGVAIGKDGLKLCFRSVCRTASLVTPEAGGAGQPGEPDGPEQQRQVLMISAQASAAKGGMLRVAIRCNSMELASDIVQDIARFFRVAELDTDADFPLEMAFFEEVRRISFTPPPLFLFLARRLTPPLSLNPAGAEARVGPQLEPHAPLGRHGRRPAARQGPRGARRGLAPAQRDVGHAARLHGAAGAQQPALRGLQCPRGEPRGPAGRA